MEIFEAIFQDYLLIVNLYKYGQDPLYRETIKEGDVSRRYEMMLNSIRSLHGKKQT